VRPSRLAALGIALAVLIALTACHRGGRAISVFEMKDLSAPSMLAHLGANLDRPYYVELPSAPITGRYDLTLSDTNERDALDALCALDATFTCSIDGGVLVMVPAGAAGSKSPFLHAVESFDETGTTAEVMGLLLERGGLKGSTEVSMPSLLASRPLALRLGRTTVRDALARLASTAHVFVVAEPGRIRIGVIAHGE
jgi:hypothetical protein